MSTKSGKTVTGKEALKAVLPIVISLVLIAAIALTVVLVKKGNNQKPAIANGDEIYFELGDLKVTKDELYTAMKQNYGVNELIRLVDNVIYKDEIAKVDDAELIKYIIKSLYSVDDIKDYTGDPQDEWDELIDSLLMNNLLKESEVDDKAFTNQDSKVWSVVKDYYRLQYARDAWAKVEYVNKYKAEKEAAGSDLFTTAEIETYYKNNYSGSVKALFIPFASSDAAYAMMKKYGINTQSSSSINADGWVKSSYDYNSAYSITEADRFTEQEVIDIFFAMYNEVLSYYNNGSDIITAAGTSKVLDYAKTLYAVKDAIQMAFDGADEIKGKVTLPTTVVVNGGQSAEITWTLADNDILAIENNIVTLKSTTATSSSVKVSLTANITIKVSDDESYKDTLTISHEASVPAEAKDDEVISVANVDALYTYALTDEFAANPGNEYSKFVWNTAELTAIDSTLATYLKYDGTLKASKDPSAFKKTYTVAPVSGTNYTFLMIKFSETATDTLDGNETLKNEIINALLEELKTENNVNKMIYDNRIAHGFKIYDKYLEAVYEYNYDYFYGTTLKLTDYTKLEETKKKEKVNAATIVVNGETVAITADQLYNELETKYGVTTVVNKVNEYQLMGNSEYNTVYNPYTGEVYNKDVLNQLLKSEISSFRNNFEMDYFTYSYLSYYGFIPNFPASYGWNDFRTDYFGATTDKNLLTSSTFGGQVYSDAYEALKKAVYPEMDKLIADQMAKTQSEHYSLNVLNLIVSIDTNYDGTYDTNDVNGDDDAWTAEQNTLAQELARLIFAKAPETGATTLSDQLAAVVALYNKALLTNELADNSYEALVATPLEGNNVWAKYKKAGLVIKFETSATYTNTSSLVQEFLDQLQILWNQVKEADLIGETLEAPIICEKPFESSYGYHYIAATATTAATDLPTEEQLEIYKALSELNDVKDLTYDYKKPLIEEKQAAYDAVLAKYGKEADFAFDETTTTLLTNTYDAAETKVLEGSELTELLLEFLNNNAHSFKMNSAEREAQLKVIIDVTTKQLNEEEGE